MREGNTPAARTQRYGKNGDARLKERGSGRFKAMVWLAILALFVFVCIKVLPVLMSGYQFEDAMKTTARFASVNRQSPDDIRKNLLQEAAKDNLPIKAEDLRITSEAGNVHIEGTYSVTVDLNFYQWTLNFHPDVTNNAL
jgi:hypothetical protein